MPRWLCQAGVSCFLGSFMGLVLVSSQPGTQGLSPRTLGRLVLSQLCRLCPHSLEHTQPSHKPGCPLTAWHTWTSLSSHALYTDRPVSTGPGLQGASLHEKRGLINSVQLFMLLYPQELASGAKPPKPNRAGFHREPSG